jgi:hypothetical protein
MSRTKVFSALATVLLTAAAIWGCAGQPSQDTELAEQAPPPEDSGMGAPIPEPPPAQRAPSRPARTETIPEERHTVTPPKPAPPTTVTVTIPAGTQLEAVFAEPLTSGTAVIGDAVVARLKNTLTAGDRVAFPADSRIEGKVTDVKSASKGFKDTGGALSITFTRIISPQGRSASVQAGFTKVAEGSAGKKAAIIGGSAVGGALLGKVLGKDAKGAALVGGAIGTAVAGSTKGKEATIAADEVITVALEKDAKTTLPR